MSLKHLVLAMLSRQPATGYEITKNFDAAVGSFWRASHQQVYRELTALSRIGLATYTTVSQKDRPDKKVYTITRAGAEELQAWLATPTVERLAKDDLLIKIWAGQQFGVATLRREIARLRAGHESALQRYQALEKAFSAPPRSDLPAALDFIVLRRAVSAEESWIAWSLEADALLDALDRPAEQATRES